MGCGCKGACVSLGYGVASGWCVARHPPSRAFPRVLVGSAASRRRTAIQMYGVSCGMLPATTHPSRTPLSLA